MGQGATRGGGLLLVGQRRLETQRRRTRLGQYDFCFCSKLLKALHKRKSLRSILEYNAKGKKSPLYQKVICLL